jgi:hypothetical protein
MEWNGMQRNGTERVDVDIFKYTTFTDSQKVQCIRYLLSVELGT